MLVPTCNRAGALAVTLAGLAAQTMQGFRVVVSDQTPEGEEPGGSLVAPEVVAAVRVLRHHGSAVELHRHLPARGMAEHRDYLLGQARAPYCLFLDDDVLLDPDVVARLLDAAVTLGCGFVGAAMQGLSHLADRRPHEQNVQWWEGPVTPERVRKGMPAWDRWRLHNAANLIHVAETAEVGPRGWRAYKVVWVAGCVLFHTAALRAAGGFSFWRDLAPGHAGEDVVAQLRVMERSGGAGIVPSGAWHLELPSQVTDRRVDAYAAVLEREDAARGPAEPELDPFVLGTAES